MLNVADSLRTRALRARRAAWLSIALIVSTVFALITFFFLYQSNTYAELLKIGDLSFQVRPPSGVAQSGYLPKEESDEIKKMRLELELKKAQIAKDGQQSSGTITAITSAVARIGAVLVGLYLVSILLSLTRYHFKLADHLFVASEVVRAFPDDLTKVSRLFAILSTKHLDFGKEPSTPADRVTEVVKEALAAMKANPSLKRTSSGKPESAA